MKQLYDSLPLLLSSGSSKKPQKEKVGLSDAYAPITIGQTSPQAE